MKAYLLRRFIGLFPVLFISSFLIFIIIHLIPGDPAVLLVPEVPPPTKEDIDAMRALYGFDKPIQVVSRQRPLICIAVVIPKNGFENFLQMSCEIGVDIIQPLISKRSVVKECSYEKTIRFQKIIHEAVEQSERLWSPEVMQVLTFSNWIKDLHSEAQVGFAATRIEDLQDCVNWLKETPHKVNQVWVVVGPEGGWNKDEEALAFDSGLSGVSMGETILRTSTAAVSACQLMTSWRRLKSSL